MGKSKMTSKAARRIQSHADKTGQNKGFKARVIRAASKKKKTVLVLLRNRNIQIYCIV